MRRSIAFVSLVFSSSLLATACTPTDLTEDGTESESSSEEEGSESESEGEGEAEATTDSTEEGSTSEGETGGVEVCDNGEDDDGDALVDCNDDDCLGQGDCAPTSWTCDPQFYGEDESTLPAGMTTCDCECGAPDPDCAENQDNGVYNCTPGQLCNDSGMCEDPPPETCGNSIDDDLDGLTDCEDTDCFGETDCPPADWVCPAAAFEDGNECNCECGALDPDCEATPALPAAECVAGEACNTTSLSCELVTGEACGDDGMDEDADGLTDCEDQECYGVGECSVPGWYCNLSLFAEGGPDAGCDCNCGAYDPDCDDDTAPVYGCAVPGSICSEEATCEIQVPDEWTCDPSFFGTNDGCDCGCGALDFDCEDATVESCAFCGLPGSCAEGEDCPATIDPTNNAVCE